MSGRRGRRSAHHGAPLRPAVLAGALAAVLALGCGLSSVGDNPFQGGGGPGSGSIQIDVENLNFNDATLYAISSGSRHRMGTIGGKSQGRFEVPWEHQRELRVRIDLLAGSDFTTRPVSVSPGERIQLMIHADVRRSTLRR